MQSHEDNFIEKQDAHHLLMLALGIRSGEFRGGDVENADETHFVIGMDNVRKLGFSGEDKVKYANAVSSLIELKPKMCVKGIAQTQLVQWQLFLT